MRPAALLSLALIAGCGSAPDAASSASPTAATIATATLTARPTAASTSGASPSPTESPAEVPTADDRRLVAALVAFARARDARTFASLPLADEVGLELDDQIPLPRPAAALARPEGWIYDVNEFNGYAGPFSVLDLLARDVPTVISIGPHPRCAGPASPTPAMLAGNRRISLQPKDIDTCLKWWAVDIYVSPAGRITTVALDLWAP